MRGLRHRLDRRRSREQGSELVEFALSSVLFFITTFGVFELGLAIWHYNVVASAAKEGARWAAVRGSTTATPATEATVAAYVNTRVYGLAVTATLRCGATVATLAEC